MAAGQGFDFGSPCPDGFWATGGGFQFSPAGSIEVSASAAYNGQGGITGWDVAGKNVSSQSIQLIIATNCVRLQ